MRSKGTPLLPVFEGHLQLEGPLQGLACFRGLSLRAASRRCVSMAEATRLRRCVRWSGLGLTNGRAYAPRAPRTKSSGRPVSPDGKAIMQHDW